MEYAWMMVWALLVFVPLFVAYDLLVRRPRLARIEQTSREIHEAVTGLREQIAGASVMREVGALRELLTSAEGPSVAPRAELTLQLTFARETSASLALLASAEARTAEALERISASAPRRRSEARPAGELASRAPAPDPVVEVLEEAPESGPERVARSAIAPPPMSANDPPVAVQARESEPEDEFTYVGPRSAAGRPAPEDRDERAVLALLEDMERRPGARLKGIATMTRAQNIVARGKAHGKSLAEILHGLDLAQEEARKANLPVAGTIVVMMQEMTRPSAVPTGRDSA